MMKSTSLTMLVKGAVSMTALLMAALAFSGCHKSEEDIGKGPAEIAGKQIDKAAVEAGKELKEAAMKPVK